MKKLIVIVLLGLLSACSLLPTDSRTRAVLAGREFTLAEGRRADLIDSPLAVQFVGVPEDQRCGGEFRCFAAGHAVVRLRLTHSGLESATLDVRTDAPDPGATYHGYSVNIVALDPVPSTADPDPDYRVRLVVSPVYTGNR